LNYEACPGKETPSTFIRMHHAYWRGCIAITRWEGDALLLHPTISIISKRFLFPNCFLGILVQREIIANASSVRISPRTVCKSTKYISKSSPNYKKDEEKCRINGRKAWKLRIFV